MRVELYLPNPLHIPVWVASEFESVPCKLCLNHPRCNTVSKFMGLLYKDVWHQTIMHTQLHYVFDIIYCTL